MFKAAHLDFYPVSASEPNFCLFIPGSNGSQRGEAGQPVGAGPDPDPRPRRVPPLHRPQAGAQTRGRPRLRGHRAFRKESEPEFQVKAK